MTPPPALTVGPYQLLRELGRGSAGVVYLACHPDQPGREFALKLVPERASDRVSSERFRREALVAARLRHPGVVGVVDAGRGAGFLYYVMDHCPGPNLRERLERQGPLAPPEAMELVAALGETLSWAHGQGVVHRDVKPENVLLGPQPRLTDFGVARDLTAAVSVTATGDILGTPWYMAPEQMLGQREVDGRADVYSLGVILYEALTGRRPFEGANLGEQLRLISDAPRPAPSGWAPRVPPRLDAICQRAMASAPEARYPDAAALVTELRACLAQGMAPPPAAPPRTSATSMPAPASWSAPPAAARPEPARPAGALLLPAAVLFGSVLTGALLAAVFRPAPPSAELARGAPAAPEPPPPPPAQQPPPPPPPPPPAQQPPPPPPAPGPLVPPPAPRATPPAAGGESARTSPRPAEGRPQPEPSGMRELVGPREALVRSLASASLAGPALIQDPALLEALRRVPRHAFVPEPVRAQAYQDMPLPYYQGRAVAKPSLMGQMIELLQVGPGDRVLELGTCSGWQTALLAHLTPQVYSVEPDPEVSYHAADSLMEQGYEQVQLRHGDPLLGWPEAAPFDAVLITGAVSEVPPRVWSQLRIGGRMVFPLVPPHGPQRLVLLVKRSEREGAQSVLGQVQFHALPRWRD